MMTTTETKKSWDRETKDHWVSTMKEHRESDRLVQGAWLGGKDASGVFRGGFFGCAMQTGENTLEKAAEAMNLPLWLLKLAGSIFESMNPENALDFPVQLLEAIPCGVSLKGVYHSTSVLRLESLLDAIPEEEKEEFTEIINLHRNWETATDKDWETARASARARAVASTIAWESVSAWASASAWESAWASSWASVSAWASARASAIASERAIAWEWARKNPRARVSAWDEEAENLIKCLKECGKTKN